MLGKFLKNITLSADGLFYALLCIFLMFLLESKRKHRGHDARRVERCLIAITSKQRLKIVSLRTVLNDQLAIHRIYIYIYTASERRNSANFVADIIVQPNLLIDVSSPN